MSRVFISYRRADSATFAGRIHDHLSRMLGDRNVFKDTYDIEGGADFRAEVQTAIAQCHVVLVLIGPRWLTVTQNGQRRLDEPNDWVRLEVEIALQRQNVRVIPILLDDAEMPRAEDLPESIRDLAFRNAMIVRNDPDFPSDVRRLVSEISPGYGQRRLKQALGVLGVLLLLLIGFGFYDRFSVGTDEPPGIGGPWQAADLLRVVSEGGVWLHAQPGDSQPIEPPVPFRSYLILDEAASELIEDQDWWRVQTLDGTRIGWVSEDPIERVPLATETTLWTPVVQAFDDVEMVLVPPGRFTMGSEDGSPDEQPVTEQIISYAYWIDRYEVTNAAYADCVEEGVCEPPMERDFFDDPQYAQHPVVFVTWEQAHAYAIWRGGRLPTEHEWEYAARGPRSLVYPWGDDFLPDHVVYKQNSNDLFAEVISRPSGASWVDAMHMSGNVWEWTSTLYRPYPYRNDEGENPTAITLSGRVLRGGSFREFPDNLRAGQRSQGLDDPANYNVNSGFRIVRDVASGVPADS